MKATDYSYIVFDLGGVLIDIDYHATRIAFEKLGFEDFDQSYSQFAQQNVFDRFERGEISAQHFINKVLPHCRPGTSPNQVVAAWNAMLGEIPAEKIALLQNLKGKKGFSMLSNTNILHLPGVNNAWQKKCATPMGQLFDQVFLSFEIGRRKPDVTTFQWVQQQLAIENPSEILFIEDSPQHIEGAQKAGWSTHFYQNQTDFYALFS
jgi:putative hydrolase of the HAD superfamily